MRIQLLGQDVSLNTTDRGTATSPHTGASLRLVEFTATVPRELANSLASELSEHHSVDSPLADENGDLWLVEQSSYSYSDDGPAIFNVQLAQTEKLFADRLRFLDLTVEPTYYREETAGPVVIQAEFDLDGDAVTSLEDALTNDAGDSYFPLVREGLAEASVSVRFGRCLWQDLDAGRRRYSLTFVSEENDAAAVPMIFEPELPNTARIAMQADEAVKALVQELASAGVLGADAAARIEAARENAWTSRYRDLFGTRDVTAFR